MFAAKVQQKNELTKYFGKKVQILYKKRYNNKTEGAGHWFDLCSQNNVIGSERSDEVPAFNLSPLTSNLKIVN